MSHADTARRSYQARVLTAAIARDDDLEDMGMHADYRATCHQCLDYAGYSHAHDVLTGEIVDGYVPALPTYVRELEDLMDACDFDIGPDNRPAVDGMLGWHWLHAIVSD